MDKKSLKLQIFLVVCLSLFFTLTNCSRRNSKKIIILQTVTISNSFGAEPISIIGGLKLPDAEKFLSLDDSADVKLYVDTNVEELLETMGLKQNDFANAFRNITLGLMGDRVYERKNKFIGHKYIAKVGSFDAKDLQFGDYDYSLLAIVRGQLPGKYSYTSIIYEDWILKNHKSNVVYNFPQLSISNTSTGESKRESYINQIRDYISSGKIGVDFEVVEESRS